MRYALGVWLAAGSELTLPSAAANLFSMIAEVPVAIEFDTIEDVVKDIAAGRLVIVTDDADRENEGDLVMAAEKATPKAINFMAMHGRGLICVLDRCVSAPDPGK